MTVLLAIVLAALHLEDDNLVTLNEWVHNFYYYLCSIYSRGTNCDITLVVYEKYLVKLNSLTSFYIFEVVYENSLEELILRFLASHATLQSHRFTFLRFTFLRSEWLLHICVLHSVVTYILRRGYNLF